MRKARIAGSHVVLSFNYDADIVEEIKTTFDRMERRWVPETKVWRVDLEPHTAADLYKFVEKYMSDDQDTLEEIASVGGIAHEKREHRITNSFVRSHAKEAELKIEGFDTDKMMPFQRAGAAYMIDKRACFNGDEMGLGKGIQAIASIQALKAYPCLYITKASLKEGMELEWRKWIPEITTTTSIKEYILSHRKGGAPAVLVTNYDQLAKNKELLIEVPWGSAVCDESQKIASNKAARTKAAKFIVKKTKPKVRFALTGTPLDSKPIQLWSQLEWLGLDHHFRNWKYFAVRYCEGHEGDWGWDTSGASNIMELYHRLRDIGFIRREKKDVLGDLPPKTPVPIMVQIDNIKEYNQRRIEIMEEIKGGDQTASLQRLAILSEIASRGKLAAYTDWLEDFRDTEKKLITFAWNVSIQKEALAIANRFGGRPVYTRTGKAQDAVSAFQEQPDAWNIVCSLEADHAGHTLTAASDVAFLQMGFLPTVIDQAGDRAHRIGQKDNVTCYFFIAQGTVEEELWEMHLKKRVVHKGVLDGKQMDLDKESLSELLRKLRV